jgi:hypothetical protein
MLIENPWIIILGYRGSLLNRSYPAKKIGDTPSIGENKINYGMWMVSRSRWLIFCYRIVLKLITDRGRL